MGIPVEDNRQEQDSEMTQNPNQVQKDVLEIMVAKDSLKPLLTDDLTESQTSYFEDKCIDINEVKQLPLLDRLVKMAETITSLIKNKTETVTLFSNYNQELEENKIEIILILANESPEKRATLIRTLFTDIIKQTHKETYVQKHLVSFSVQSFQYLKQIILLCRNVIVNFFPPLMKEHAICLAVEEILNPHQPLYKNLQDNSNMIHSISGSKEFDQNKVRWLNAVSKKIANQIDENNHQWRLQLKAGDYIDAICKQNVSNTQYQSKEINSWQPAKIAMCDNDGNLLISFLRLPRSQDQKIDRLSPNIAPTNKYTDKWNERFNLKVDDELSCADEYGNWYRSTIIKIDESPNQFDIEKNTIPKVRVAYKYQDPQGVKTDDLGRKWTGWISAKFDTDVNLAQPCIQPLFVMTYQYSNVQPDMMTQYTINVKDSDDIIYPSSTEHQWARYRPDDRLNQFGNMVAFVDMINEFGQRNGFEIIKKVLEDIAEGTFPTTIQYLLSVQKFLVRTLPLWTRQFCCLYGEKISNYYMSAIISEKSSIAKNIDLETINQLTNSYEQIIKRNFVVQKVEQKATQLKIKLASSLLLSENLQRRINGIKLVTDEIRTLMRYGNTFEQQQEIIQDFLKIDIFSQVFHPHRIHLQILQRSQEIIKIYAKCKYLNSDHIDLLWNSTLIDETAQIEVYKIVQESSQVIPDELLEQFINKIKDSMDTSKTTVREVEFIHTIGKNAYYKSSARQSAFNVLWQFAMIEKQGYSKSILKPSRKFLFDLVRNQDREIVETYIFKCTQIIEQKTGASVQATKLLLKLLDSEKIPKYVYQNQYGNYNQNVRNLSQFVKDLCINHKLIDKIIDDLENFVNMLGLDEGFDHRKAVWTRLRALLYIQNAMDDKTILEADQVNRIWNMLFDSSDTSLFFDWFQKVISNQEWVTTNTKMICELFETKVLGNQQKILSQAVHINGFHCIQQLFLQVNEKANNLNISTLNKNQNMYNRETKRQKTEFRIHVEPSQLIGMDLIWSFFIASCYKQEENELKKNITAFIAQIYGSTSQLISAQINQVYSEFIGQCFQKIREVLQSSLAQNVKSEHIKNTMLMLQTFFQDTESGGTAGIRPHLSLESEKSVIENLLITSYLTSSNNHPKFIQLTLSSQTTVWELIDYIGKKLNKSPLKLQLSRVNGKPEVKPSDYCKSLKELKFENNEEVTVQRTSQNLLRLPLINPQTGQLVREAQAIFESWFFRYSILQEDNKRYMTKQTALEFLQNALSETNQKVVTKKLTLEDQRIVQLFQNHDLDQDDMLTEDDFIRFYRIKSNESSETVWQNLQAYGYGNNLTKELKGDTTYENDPLVTRDQSKLPRSLISENLQQLEILFNLYSDDQSSNAEIWKLISSLKTNSQIYQTLLKSNDPLEELSPDKPVFQLLYNLQIIQNLIQKYTPKEQSLKETAVLYLERAKVVRISYNEDFPKIGQDSQPSLKPIEEEKYEEEVKYKNLGASSSWNSKIATGETIALPSAADAAPQDAPATQSKLSYNQQQIQAWKGDIVTEEMTSLSLFESETDEQAWLIKFLTNGGFKALTNLLKRFIEQKKFVHSQAERDCVKLVTHMINIILISAFCANSLDNELIQDLSRKMSTCSQGPAESLSKIETEQKQIQQQFQPLIQLLQTYEFAPQQLLVDDPKMEKFLNLLRQIFDVILYQQADECTQIVADCLNIWISMITNNSNCLFELYNDQEYLNLFLDYGLLSTNQMLRIQFKEAIEFVSRKVKQEELPQAPAIFFLDVLIKKLQQIKSTSKEYFNLIEVLMQNYYSIKKNKPIIFQTIFDPKNEVIKALNLLNQYQSTESRSKQTVDDTLVGLLNLVKNLISFEQEDILSIKERSIVLEMLVEKCLFNQQGQEFEGNITSQVDFKLLNQVTLNKCHTDESRESAYNLFQALLGTNPDQQVLHDLIRKYWVPSIMSLSQNKSQQLASSDKDNRSELGYAGLRNLGCICYMNAIIQQFYHVPAFRYLLLAADDQKAPNIVTLPNGHELDDNSLHQWMKMFGSLELTDRECYNPEDFCYAFKSRGQPTNVREQQDAQEFVTSALDKIEESLKHTPMKDLVKDTFLGINTNITICKSCFNIVQTDEDFTTLHLGVKNQKDLYASLRSMVAGEIVSGYKCAGCSKLVDIEKKLAIKKLPNTLIVHLNRIIFDFDKMGNNKLNDKIDFPELLQLKDFMLDEVLKNIKKPVQEPVQEDAKEQQMEVDQEPIVQEDKNPDDFEYKLVGVVIHMGTADAGHYISYVNVDRYQDSSVNTSEWLQTSKQTWIEFNDSQVKPFDFNFLAYKCFGESQETKTQIITSQEEIPSSLTSQAAHNAYMLVYEKRVKQPLRIVLDEQMISLVCDGTTIPRELPQVFQAVPDLIRIVKENQSQRQFEIQFNSVTKFVPNQIYKFVNNDNQQHIAESQLCRNQFFKTTAMMLSNLIKQNNPSLINDIYTIIDKLIFDLLIRTTQNAELENLTNILIGLIDKQPQLLVRLLNERILFQQVVSDNVFNHPFLEMFIFHKEQPVREICELLLTKVTSLLFNLVQQELPPNQLSFYQESLKRIIETTCTLIPNKLTNAWHKLGPFFNFLYNTLKDMHQDRFSAFSQYNLVTRLVELICKIKEHFQNGYNFGQPPIEFAVQTLSLFILQQPLVIWLYKLPSQSQVTIDEYQAIIENQGFSPYHTQGNQFYMQFDDLRSIFMADKNTKSFWEISFTYAGSKSALQMICKAMAHCCYKNYDFSKKILKVLITGLNKTQVEDLKIYAVAMQWFLTIKDEFQTQRIEWCLGIPNLICKPQQSNYYSNERIPNYRIGASKITEIEDIIYEYPSPALKDNSSKQTESVLFLMYNYRKSAFDEAILVIIEHLLQKVVEDSVLMDYLLNCPGPSYVARRYWDWFEPFILNNIQNGFQNGNNITEKTDLSLRVFSLIEQIKQTHAQRILTIEGPQPFITWDVVSFQDVKTVVNHKKEFHVVIKQYTTTISKSTPNPAELNNDNLAKVNRGAWAPTTFVPSAAKQKQPTKKKISRNKKKVYGRGQRQQKTQRQKKQNQWNQDDEELTNINLIPKDAVYAQVEVDEEQAKSENWSNENNVQADFDLQFQDQPNQTADLEIINNALQTDELAAETPIDFEPQQPLTEQIGVAGETGGNIQMVQQEGDDSTELSNEEEQEENEIMKYEVESFIEILLRNFSRTKTQTVQIKFNSNSQDTANYYIPKSVINQQVATTTDSNFLRIQKLRPYEGLGELDFEFYVDQEDMEGNLRKLENNWPQLRALRNVAQQIQQPVNEQFQVNYEDIYDDGGAIPIITSENGDYIECSVCTYHNNISSNKCEMCDSDLK